MMRRGGTTKKRNCERDFLNTSKIIKCTKFHILIELCEIQTYATNDTLNMNIELKGKVNDN